MTPQGVKLAQELIDHNEWGIGFDINIEALVTRNAELAPDAIALVAELGRNLPLQQRSTNYVQSLTGASSGA